MADKRIERTRAALTEAILALLAQRDFATLTIGDIVAQADIGYATFFRHYKDKEELLLDASDRLTDRLLPSILPALQSENMGEAALALCRHVEANDIAFTALLTAATESRVQRLLIERSIIRAEALQLPDAPQLPPDLAIGFAVQAIHGLLSWWLRSHPRLPAADMARIIDRLVLTPVRMGG